jgi:hypothetical protein
LQVVTIEVRSNQVIRADAGQIGDRGDNIRRGVATILTTLAPTNLVLRMQTALPMNDQYNLARYAS